MTNLAPSTVTIQTGQTVDFSNVHNFVNNFVWGPIQITYCSESRGASFALNMFEKEQNKTKKSQGVLPGTVRITLRINSLLICLFLAKFCMKYQFISADLGTST